MNKLINNTVKFLEQFEIFELLYPISHADLAVLFITALVVIWVVSFIFKSMLILVLRQFGCSTPELYSRFPTIPWRSFYIFKMRVARWYEQIFKFGKIQTGGFASVFSVLTNTFDSKKFFLGRAWFMGFGLFQSIGIKLTKHILVVAGTGSGKTSTVIAALAQHRGSAFVLDPTGIIKKTLAQADSSKEYLEYAPYNPRETAQINPFDDVKAAMKREGANAAVKWSYRIGLSFIKTASDSKQPYFTDTARGFFVGLFLHILTTHPEEEHNLGVLRDLIIHGYRYYDENGKLESTADESKHLLYRAMMQNPAYSGAVSGAAAPFINASSETRGNLVSTLQEKTRLLDDPDVRHFFSKTTRPLSDLKTEDDLVAILYIQLSSLRGELNGLALLVQNLICYTFESIKEKKGDCLFIVDEVQAQGFNQTLETALPVARSQGLFIVAITQDLEGLKAAYPKTHLSFIGNADCVLWMGTAHPQNLRQLSLMLGKKTIVTKDRNTGRKTYRDVEVESDEQLGRFLSPETGNYILTVSGKRAWRLKLDPFFKSLPVWSYAADPNHKESLLKRFGRFLFGYKAKS
jgi:type IV secretory pathway TraG/TraD family ATPase VirD4|tara:strand:- start:4616 stop:6343 length:1728 start_codon:yes stop_codon:yes gene_type:complete